MLKSWFVLIIMLYLKQYECSIFSWSRCLCYIKNGNTSSSIYTVYRKCKTFFSLLKYSFIPDNVDSVVRLTVGRLVYNQLLIPSDLITCYLYISLFNTLPFRVVYKLLVLLKTFSSQNLYFVGGMLIFIWNGTWIIVFKYLFF